MAAYSAQLAVAVMSVCACAGLTDPLAAQGATGRGTGQTALTSSYVAAEDASLVTAPLLVRHTAGRTVRASLKAVWRGTGPIPPLDDVTLEFIAFTSFGSRRAEWAFQESHDLTVVIDGTESRTYPGEHEGGVQSSSLIETVSFWVPVADVARIGSARTVEGRLGGWAFTLTPKEIARAREMALYLARDPAAPVPVAERPR